MRFLLSAAAALSLAGCAFLPFTNFDFAPGTPREAVLARAGQPGTTVRTATGERMIYSLQPVGRQAWVVDLDRAGKVVRVEQALTEQNLERIQPGWSRLQVEAEFGPPAWTDRVQSWEGTIMNYRWRDQSLRDMWYWVYVDAGGVVRRAHPGVEYPLPGGDASNDAPAKD
jgi:hypothetical protein